MIKDICPLGMQWLYAVTYESYFQGMNVATIGDLSTTNSHYHLWQGFLPASHENHLLNV
jgi:hypothetical protein